MQAYKVYCLIIVYFDLSFTILFSWTVRIIILFFFVVSFAGSTTPESGEL